MQYTTSAGACVRFFLPKSHSSAQQQQQRQLLKKSASLCWSASLKMVCPDRPSLSSESLAAGQTKLLHISEQQQSSADQHRYLLVLEMELVQEIVEAVPSLRASGNVVTAVTAAHLLMSLVQVKQPELLQANGGPLSIS